MTAVPSTTPPRSNTNRTLRVLLIDDHALFRAGMRVLLESELEDAVIEEAPSIRDAVAQRAAPSVILLDVELPGLNGIDGLALVEREWPTVPVVMLSAHAESPTIERAIAQGARAFIPKATSVPRMIEVVRAALANEPTESGVPPRPRDRPRLTPRQLETLELLCLGLTNRAIGKRLGVSENTVRGHVQSILFELDASTRSEAIVIARRDGLVG